ncbi:MAG: signal transduction histidine kinase [Alphaproteobacteria bacterium]|nr:signal transduction histidine kinase [Alphaproteobacteria bacterium]
MNTLVRYSAIALIPAILAVLVGCWLWLVAAGGDQALQEAKERARGTVARAAGDFTEAIQSIELVLDQANQGLGERDLASLAQDKTTSSLFAELARRIPNMRGIWVADNQGRIVLGDSTAFSEANLPVSDFFLAHAANQHGSLVGASLKNGKSLYLVPLSRRLDRSGMFAGVLFATASPGWFQSIADELDLPNQAGVAFLTRQGNVVASTWPLIDSIGGDLRSELARRAATRGDFDTYTVSVKNADNDTEDILVGYRPVKGLNLVALYAVPYVTALQAWSFQLWIGSAIIGAAVVLIIGAAILLLIYGRRQGDLHRMIGLRTAEAAQAAERLSLAIDTTGIGIFDYRIGRPDVAWAGVEPGYFGLRTPPGLTPRAFLRSVHPSDRRGLVKRLRTMKAARDDTRFDTEFRLRHPEFGVIWVAARAKLFTRNGNGNGKGPGRLIGTLRDITERRRLQEHRETVLREINHRIKNSLQLMNSIMNLQSRRITSADERARFESARRRLISLATVYAHLDDTTQPDVVDLVPFLRRLCQDFSVAYMADGRINLTFSADGARPVSATLAVPLGMAMGEILVNISLNGFAPQASGSVLVNVGIETDQVEITISHNGRSVEEAFNGDGANLGRLLIDAFVDQLGGRFSATNTNPGLIFTIRFRAPPVHAARPIKQAPPQRNSTY